MLDTRQQLRVLTVLAILQFSHIVDFMVLMPLGPQLMRLFEITPQQFSFLVSVYTFTAGIASLIGVFIFDRIDRKHALLVAYAGFLVGTLGCALAPNYEVLLLGRAVSGMFGGLLSGISFAIIADTFSVEKRGFAVGRVMASFSLAAVLGVPMGLLLANQFEWHAPFFAIALIGVLILGLAYLWIPNVREHIKDKSDHTADKPFYSGLTEALADMNCRKSLGLTFTMMMSQFMVIPFVSPYITANAGFPESYLPLLYLIGGSFTAFSGPLMGKLCDIYSAPSVFAKTGLLFLFPIFAITHLPEVAVWVTLVVSTSFFVLSNARFVPAMTLISSSIPPERRGSFMSFNSAIQQLGAASASFIGGLLISQGADGRYSGYQYTAYLGACFGLIAYFLGRKIKIVS